MRILGFSKEWDKLKQDEFTTFRFSRRDRDWEVGEVVQVVYKPRSKEREVLGVVEIVSKEARCFAVGTRHCTTREEAIEDGFSGFQEMRKWLLQTHGKRVDEEWMNKLTLRWVR